MTHDTRASQEADPTMPAFDRGARARRAPLLRRAANRISRRILRSLGAEPRPVLPASLEATPRVFEQSPLGSAHALLARPVEPDVALEEERNRWGGRL
jgi:hypothetical protein